MILMHRFIRITDDEVHNLMNIETVIPNDKESHVRVLISYPNSRIVVKESFDKLTSSLIKNPTLKNWSTCAIKTLGRCSRISVCVAHRYTGAPT